MRGAQWGSSTPRAVDALAGVVIAGRRRGRVVFMIVGWYCTVYVHGGVICSTIEQKHIVFDGLRNSSSLHARRSKYEAGTLVPYFGFFLLPSRSRSRAHGTRVHMPRLLPEAVERPASCKGYLNTSNISNLTRGSFSTQRSSCVKGTYWRIRA
jgi:hypothetical protein